MGIFRVPAGVNQKIARRMGDEVRRNRQNHLVSPACCKRVSFVERDRTVYPYLPGVEEIHADLIHFTHFIHLHLSVCTAPVRQCLGDGYRQPQCLCQAFQRAHFRVEIVVVFRALSAHLDDACVFHDLQMMRYGRTG